MLSRKYTLESSGRPSPRPRFGRGMKMFPRPRSKKHSSVSLGLGQKLQWYASASAHFQDITEVLTEDIFEILTTEIQKLYITLDIKLPAFFQKFASGGLRNHIQYWKLWLGSLLRATYSDKIYFSYSLCDLSDRWIYLIKWIFCDYMKY